MLHIRFTNSNEPPIFIQIDPWAGLYQLRKGEHIEFMADSKGRELLLDIEEYNDTRVLTLPNSDEYYVLRNGNAVHWREYPTNIER